MKKLISIFLLCTSLLFPCVSCKNNIDNNHIYSGYSEYELIPEDTWSPLYMGGYSIGMEFEGVLDYQKVKATYLNFYGDELLMMSIDCVGLSSYYVNKIRKGIGVDFNINISSTHTHAGIDTLGLWGPIANDGKNKDFMDLLVNSAIKAGKEAISNYKEGSLTYGQVKTEDVLLDSRNPYVYDENLYQLRFIPNDESPATRMIFYGAHAEALRGSNKLLSADFPGYMAKVIKERTGENCIYFNGAIGGLIMTKTYDGNDLVNNMKITGEVLAEYALSIHESVLVKGHIKQKTIKFNIELENTIFKYYGFLGILKTTCYKNIFNGKYYMKTETSILQISDLTFVLIPGEIFPELVYGGSRINEESTNENPNTILELASNYGIDKLIIVGLCNDEIGYIVPPSDFLVNEDYPYIQDRPDSTGENHYEETNSTGLNAAYSIYNALEKIFKKI